MKRISKAVLAALLVSVAATGLSAAPAFAKKKEDTGGITLNDTVRAAAMTAKDAITAKNYPAAETAVAQAEAAAKTDDEKYVASMLRYGLASQMVADRSQSTNGVYDPTGMFAPLNALISNPRTPPTELPKYLYTLGTISFETKQWARATSLFTRAQQAGSTEPNLPLYVIKSKVEGGDVAGGLAQMDALWTANPAQITDDYYNYAIAKANKANLRTETVKWMRRQLVSIPTVVQWNETLYFYGLQPQSMVKLDAGQMVDLLRLLRLSKAIADQAGYENYIQASAAAGLPSETKSVIAEAKAAGKLPTPINPVIATLSTKADAAVKAEGTLAALDKKAGAAAKGEASAQAGDAHLGRGEYAKAITFYQQALSKGVTDKDAVNTHLGIALAMSGDKAGAKTAFAAVTDVQRADIAAFWLTWLDTPPTS
jgi:tetratricopeptide (TPR) repeat protein